MSPAVAGAQGAPDETPLRALAVVTAVCLVCSLMVASSVVLLGPRQRANLERTRQRHVLSLVQSIPALRELLGDRIEGGLRIHVVELETGEYDRSIDPTEFDARDAERDPRRSVRISPERDLAGIGRRARHAAVYVVETEAGIDTLILPVHGQGYLSTLRGYLALAGDGNTIRGLSFYEHGETPGLGSEIDTEAWLSQWRGKQLFDEAGEPLIRVVKGRADPASPYEVDGIAGATRTGDGVMNLIRFWTGPDGFGPYLERTRAGG
jgi:Na+-transporting NADH:ubiquinone oxidoreductase subunit C